MKRRMIALFLALLALACPMLAVAEAAGSETDAAAQAAQLAHPAQESLQAAPKTVFHIDGAAFVDSLQYMLKGMVGIFLVTAIIILAVVILEKATKKKED